MSAGQFEEPSDHEKQEFLAHDIGDGLDREDLIESMERLLTFVENSTYRWESDYYALIYATIARSARTYEGICRLLRACLPAQAAILSRSLFEDVIVAHWMVSNHDDQDWLVERFLRHREAIALHQEKVREETGFSIGPPIPVGDDPREREAALIEEFGRQATRNWWDPGREGHGKGKDLGLRKVVTRLEKLAAKRVMFFPRFAGGEEPLLDRMDRVVHKWLSQCVHHTVAGLPFAPTGRSGEYAVERPNDQTVNVGFSASWLFAQQIYLIFELNHMGFEHIDAVWFQCLARFMIVIDGPESAERLVASWESHYGKTTEEPGP